jgi:hypothetical protein
VLQIDNAIDKIMMFLSTNILCYCQFLLIVFYHWFIHVLPLEIQLFRGENCDTINWFIHVLPLEIQLFRGEDCDTINKHGQYNSRVNEWD